MSRVALNNDMGKSSLVESYFANREWGELPLTYLSAKIDTPEGYAIIESDELARWILSDEFDPNAMMWDQGRFAADCLVRLASIKAGVYRYRIQAKRES
jgi:hypothetical protein